MIILIDKPGQMCNRLWAFSFFIAYGLKNDVDVFIPNFKEYESLFENLSQFKNVKFKLSKNAIIDRIGQAGIKFIYSFHKAKIGFFLRIFHIYFPKRNLLNEFILVNKNIVYIRSWKHKKDFDDIIEFKSQIISLFTPKAEYRIKFDTLLLKLTNQYDILIGVHIRRGDYLNFQRGIYYFDDSVYCKFMTMLKNELASKRVHFIISSNEKINPEKFCDLNIYKLENSLGIEDLYALSKCDYIMGPPSTFSMWASFYGSVPLKLLEAENEEFTLDDFSIIRYQNNFENGKKYD